MCFIRSVVFDLGEAVKVCVGGEGSLWTSGRVSREVTRQATPR
jgi:hypothetical protein